MEAKLRKKLVAQPLASPGKIAATLTAQGDPISRTTIRRFAREEGLFPYRLHRQLHISVHNRLQCTQWAREHEQWTEDHWMNVLCSDEIYLHLHHTPVSQNERCYP